MPERWRRALGRLDREDPDEHALRARAEEGPRMPEPSASTGSRVVAAAVALLLAIGGTTLAVRAFRSEGSGPGTASIDPAAVCGFTPRHGPEYVSLDGHEIPQAVLDEPGVHVSDLQPELVTALKPFILDGGMDAANPPEDGWRVIDQDADGATVAAPNGEDWYVARIDSFQGSLRVGGWAPYAPVLPTAADQGAGLRLTWNGTTEVQQGDHAQFHLGAVNDGTTSWRDDRGEYWAITHVFDPVTGRELFPDEEYFIAGVGQEYDVPPGGRFDVRVAASPRADHLDPGTYELVGCVRELSLVSPVGELRVLSDASSAPSTSPPPPDVTILVAKRNNTNAALADGTLAVVDGCLALEGTTGAPTFVVWPVGSHLVAKDGRTSVVDAAGATVAEVGTRVRLGGGMDTLPFAQQAVDGDIPEPCQVNGERYFIAGSVVPPDSITQDLGGNFIGITHTLGFELTIPDTWSMLDIDGFDERVTIMGTVVSSVPLPKPTSQQILPDLSALPAGEVALGILHTEGGASQVPGVDTALPLRYEDFAIANSCCGWDRVQSFTMGGTDFTLWLAGGGDGLTQHEDDLRAIVASIRPVLVI